METKEYRSITTEKATDVISCTSEQFQTHQLPSEINLDR